MHWFYFYSKHYRISFTLTYGRNNRSNENHTIQKEWRKQTRAKEKCLWIVEPNPNINVAMAAIIANQPIYACWILYYLSHSLFYFFQFLTEFFPTLSDLSVPVGIWMRKRRQRIRFLSISAFFFLLISLPMIVVDVWYSEMIDWLNRFFVLFPS